MKHIYLYNKVSPSEVSVVFNEAGSLFRLSDLQEVFGGHQIVKIGVSPESHHDSGYPFVPFDPYFPLALFLLSSAIFDNMVFVHTH